MTPTAAAFCEMLGLVDPSVQKRLSHSFSSWATQVGFDLPSHIRTFDTRACLGPAGPQARKKKKKRWGSSFGPCLAQDGAFSRMGYRRVRTRNKKKE